MYTVTKMISGNTSGIENFSCKSWWVNSTRKTKNLITIGAAFGTTLTIFLLIVIHSLYFGDPGECSSSTCARISLELLLKYVDIKVDPCKDFYRFSCGNFLQNTKLDNRGSWSVQNVMEEEIRSQIKNMLEEPIQTKDAIAFNLAKKFYRACMNETAIEAEGLKRMKQIFKQIGGWPTLNGNNWRKDLFNWKDAVYKLRQIGINFESFFMLTIQRDKTDRSRYILNIKAPYTRLEINTEIKKSYLKYMIDIAVLLGCDKERATKEQKQVLDFLLKLAEISTELSAANKSELYNPLSLSELQYEFPYLHWAEYINHILAPAAQITYDDEISVSEPLYIKKMLELLKYTEKRVIANFMCWNILNNLIPYLPTKLTEQVYSYFENVHGKQMKTSRSNTCFDVVENRLSTVISATYIKKYLDEHTRSSALSMIRNIKFQFRTNLNKLHWLDERTKKISVEMLASSVEDIPHHYDFVEINKLLEQVEIFDDKLLTSVLNLDYVTTNIEYGKLRQVVRNNFFEKPGLLTGLNILYYSEENALRIPPGKFRGIFYGKDRPQYLNYGALGSIIAHELYHIITQAKYKGQQGELRSWWSSHSLLNYEKKMQCLTNHYGKFIVNVMDNGNNTNSRDENMADLAGLKVAYDAYIKWIRENGVEPRLPGLNFSPNQLFWISSAIHHCTKYSTQTLQRYIANYQRSPGQIRVNSPLQNLDEFALDFGCAPETYMSPKHKCRIW